MVEMEKPSVDHIRSVFSSSPFHSMESCMMMGVDGKFHFTNKCCHLKQLKLNPSASVVCEFNINKHFSSIRLKCFCPPRGIWNCTWLRCSQFSWKCASQIVSAYILCLNLLAVAHSPVSSSPSYACENDEKYYSSVEHLKGEELKKGLNSIIATHRSLSYKEVWNALKILDAANVDMPETSTGIVEIYSLIVVPKLLAGKPEGWNREHLWPRSYGLTSGPMLSDLHNIRPADINVNSSRGNKYYGECNKSSGGCIRPANREAAIDTETDNERWAPPVQVRGDIARALMYMAVCYGYHGPNGSGGLHLSDSPSIAKKEMGLLSTLLNWNEVDPPSREERLRNERICKLYQHNRNPFVDHPEYANLIWTSAIGSTKCLPIGISKAWINEVHYNNKGRDRNEFVEVMLGASTNLTELELILYNGSNGKMYSSLPLTDNATFRVTNDGSSFVIYTAFLPIQNGPADGIALVSRNGSCNQVLDFISYDGTVKAIDGPARGIESVDIGLQETNDCAENDSLGLTGTQVGKYEWRRFLDGATPVFVFMFINIRYLWVEGIVGRSIGSFLKEIKYFSLYSLDLKTLWLEK
ncbi:Endonuclease I, partial [Dillenia turbinata]